MKEQDLYACVDDALRNCGREYDARCRGEITIALGQLLQDQFDQQLKEAFEAARGYWGGRETDEGRLLQLTEVSRRIDNLAQLEQDQFRREHAKLALVSGALNTNTGMTWFAGENLIEQSLRAGLSVEDLDRVFAQKLAGYRSP